jgi:hypothetical protein
LVIVVVVVIPHSLQTPAATSLFLIDLFLFVAWGLYGKKHAVCSGARQFFMKIITKCHSQPDL